ncbi:transcriptional regulator, AraC family protein [Paenibacillus vortex V453]|uniref:Transcriptional regulator, AraC family protein n=1 Tax=Paenibacillus vortex V453 TaxID=715225 RepID=A0A2R9SUG0_9BACL|nr:AraC family transcriptional regulator [Paenibacillus vortex]EFU40983.1 transcriptional regulator, AraC family protein [Paenibacillus vortex V453]
MSEEIRKHRNVLVQLLERHANQSGVHKTDIPSLFFIRHLQVTEPVHRVYNPSLCFIAQGSKEVLLAQERYVYGPADYLISSMNVPVVGQVIHASNEVPFLSLKLEFTQNQILEVLNEYELPILTKENARRALFVGQMEASLLEAMVRLARLLDHPAEISFLAPLYIKEILFRLLQGPYGVALAQIAMEGSSTYRIRDTIEQIIRHRDQPLRIESLAETARMSVSSFHRHFKEVTAMSPLQFQKQLRLQEARRLLLSESADAADVAFRVGYESPSQFSREYARLFGCPPRTDIKQLKEKYDVLRDANTF